MNELMIIAINCIGAYSILGFMIFNIEKLYQYGTR